MAKKILKKAATEASGVDRKRSLAAKKAAKTRVKNRALAAKRQIRLHHKVIAGGAIAAVLVLTLLGIRSQLQTYAATTATGTFTGLAGKCLDNQHSLAVNHNRIQLYRCNGTNAQRWTVTSSGAVLSGNNSSYCLDIPGSSKAEYTYLQLYKCNGTMAQKFKISGNQIISSLTGFCATVRYAETANSTRIWMKTCHGSAAQKWVYSGNPSTGGTTPTPPPSTGSGGSTPVTGGAGDSGGNGITPSGSDITPYSSLSGADFSSKINSAGSKYAALPSGSYTFRDFAYGTQGLSGTGAQGVGAYGTRFTSSKGILGAGSKYTTISMVPNSSTKAAYVPPEPANGSPTARTNQLQYLLADHVPSFKVDGVHIAGTSQGHLYNGFLFNGVTNVTVSNTTVSGIPGHDSGPPGETFSLNVYNLPAGGTANFTNVTMDGSKVAAVGIGLNSIHGTITMRNLLTENTAYSAGIAGWQMAGTDNYYNWVNTNSVRSYNAERHSGTSNFYDPVWGEPSSGHYDINYTWESGWKGGSINFYFSSAQAWQNYIANRSTKKITIVTNPHGQGDIRSTVHVYVGGVQQTQSNYVQFSGLAS